MKQIDGFWFPDRDQHWGHGCYDYQRDVFQEAMSLIPGHMREVSVDVGAHVGLQTVMQNGAGFRRVLAFEPDAENYQCLVLNTRLCPRVTPIFAALSNMTGFAKLIDPAPYNTGASHLGEQSSPNDARSVPTLRFDEFGVAPNYVKIDVEGHELRVLVGMMESLLKGRPVVTVENATPEIHEFMRTYYFEPARVIRRDTIFAPMRDIP
jgi:FkbM family methyltransferase